MADVSPATALLARTVQGVWLNADERETVLAELDGLREAHGLTVAALADANTEIVRLKKLNAPECHACGEDLSEEQIYCLNCIKESPASSLGGDAGGVSQPKGAP